MFDSARVASGLSCTSPLLQIQSHVQQETFARREICPRLTRHWTQRVRGEVARHIQWWCMLSVETLMLYKLRIIDPVACIWCSRGMSAMSSRFTHSLHQRRSLWRFMASKVFFHPQHHLYIPRQHIHPSWHIHTFGANRPRGSPPVPGVSRILWITMHGGGFELDEDFGSWQKASDGRVHTQMRGGRQR